eukprot:468992-Alexandrium_andersonii.AAC.1
MARSPFGPDGVSARWPYLGGVVGTRAAAGAPPPGRWAPLEARRMREAAWRKALDKYTLRSATLGGSLLPPGGRAGAWNTYVVT